MGQESSSNDRYLALLKDVNRIVTTRGMSKEEYEQRKDLFVAPGWTVKDLLQASLDIGQIHWIGGVLIFRGKKNGASAD